MVNVPRRVFDEDTVNLYEDTVNLYFATVEAKDTAEAIKKGQREACTTPLVNKGSFTDEDPS